MMMGLEQKRREWGYQDPLEGSGDPIPASKELMGSENTNPDPHLLPWESTRAKGNTGSSIWTLGKLPCCEMLRHSNGLPSQAVEFPSLEHSRLKWTWSCAVLEVLIAVLIRPCFEEGLDWPIPESLSTPVHPVTP